MTDSSTGNSIALKDGLGQNHVISLVDVLQAANPNVNSIDLTPITSQFQTPDQFVWALEFDFEWKKKIEQIDGYSNFLESCAHYIENNIQLKAIYTPEWWANNIAQRFDKFKWANGVYFSPLFKAACIGVVIVGISMAIMIPALLPMVAAAYLSNLIILSFITSLLTGFLPAALANIHFLYKERMENTAFKNFYMKSQEILGNNNDHLVLREIGSDPVAYLQLQRNENNICNRFYSLFRPREDKPLESIHRDLPQPS